MSRRGCSPSTRHSPRWSPRLRPGPVTFAQPGVTPVRPAKPRRMVELGAIAVVTAVLASAGTYAATRADGAPAPVAQISAGTSTAQSPVVQANALAPNWSATAAVVSPSFVAITVTSGQSGDQGSGVIFDTQGHILTNDHVVAGAGPGAQIPVTLADKRTYDATVGAPTRPPTWRSSS